MKSTYEAKICPRIASARGFYSFGGNQAWFSRNSAYKGGCGPVSGANILLSLSLKYPQIKSALSIPIQKDRIIAEEYFIALMEQLYQTMNVLEVPILNRIYDNLSRQNKYCSKLPINLGIGACRFIRGVLLYGLKNDVFLKHYAISTMFCSYEKGLSFIRFALEKEFPISLLTTNNSYEFMLYDSESFDGGSMRKMHRHFVTITGICDKGNGTAPELIVSTWGKPGIIPFDVLHQSWHSPLAVGSTMVFFAPTNSKKNTQYSLLKAFAALVSI